jgi:UDP-2,4-diacetamido-2,4,6-trideoxy-beta-L-altropyranose hydrolase
MKTAFFSFEASLSIGAGHAIRSTVLADALTELGWDCKIVSSKETYDFIQTLDRFKRIDPNTLHQNPEVCDLLVIDNYNLDYNYEKHFRPYAKKIMVIDDLANKKHDCDILLDQTYERNQGSYKNLVPKNCKILVGSDYVLLRKEFTQLRPRALEKRQKTKEIKRILVSMGGTDPKNYTLKALDMIKESSFKGDVDIVLGFAAPNIESVKKQIINMPNECTIHQNADMPKLIYEADLAIGAAGSSVWERCCLGIKQFVFKTAENQIEITKIFNDDNSDNFFKINTLSNKQKELSTNIDGLGVTRTLNFIEENKDKLGCQISHKKVKAQDIDQIYKWQQYKEIRQFSFDKKPPTYSSHKKWFTKKLDSSFDIFEMILCNNKPCGAVRLDYIPEETSYLLNWYIIPDFQKRRIGTIALNFAKKLPQGKKIKAFVFKDNLASHKAFEKAGFSLKSQQTDGKWYEY